MKTTLLSLTMAALFTTTTFATDNNDTDNTNKPKSMVTSMSAWVTAPKATFDVRTYKTTTGRLVVQVKNTGQRPITVTLNTPDGQELAFASMSKRQTEQAIKFDVNDIADGDYVVRVGNTLETISKSVKLVTVPQPARQAIIAVAE